MATSIAYLEQMLQNKNIQAAVMAIRKCEGTAMQDGYRYLFGSTPSNATRFNDFSTHPNIKKQYTDKAGKTITTSAAGAYQITHPTYEGLCDTYGFKDFTPHTQDLMAVALFDQANVLKAVAEGRFFEPKVLDALNNIWASLPGAGYNQPERSLVIVKGFYTTAGGEVVS
jgi:muramidase (phage lysozyme)